MANTVTFGVTMVDGVSGPADEAADSLANLQDEINGDVAALARMQKAMRELKAPVDAEVKNLTAQLKALKAAATPDADAIGNLTKRIAELKGPTGPNAEAIAKLGKSIQLTQDKIASGQAKFVSLGGTFEKAKPKAKSLEAALRGVSAGAATVEKAAPKMKGFEAALQGLSAGGGPLGALASKLSFVGGLLKNKTVLLAAAAAGFVALGYAVGRAVVSMTQMAVASANTRRAQLLELEGLTRIRTAYTIAYGVGADKASDLQRTIDEVSGSVSISRERVAAYARELYMAGARGDRLKSALKGTAIVASAAGEEQAGMFKQMAGALALTGGNVDKLTQRAKNQFGKVVAAQMTDLNVQAQKLKESQDSLFDGLDISGYANANKALNDLWSNTTNAGKYMRDLLGRVFQPFVDAGTFAFRSLKWWFQEAIIRELQLEIAYYRLRKALREAFAGDWQKALKNLDSGFATVAFGIGVVVTALVISLVPALVSATVAFGSLAAGAIAAGFAVAWPFLLAAGAVWAFIELLQIDWSDFGLAIKQGIIEPLSGIGDWFAGLGGDIKNSFKRALGIASPSKVFAEYGEDIALGIKIGVDAKSGEAQGAVNSAVGAPSSGGGAGGSSGGGVTIGELHLHVGEAKGARALGESVKRELERILQGVAMQMAAPAPEGGTT